VADVPFDIWYCEAFPLDLVTAEPCSDHPDRPKWVEAVAESIAQRGLVNPVLITNWSPNGKAPPNNRVKCGLNRIGAMRLLGWTHCPAIVFGTCDIEPRLKITLQEANEQYIKDGQLERSGYGLRMAGNKHPLEWSKDYKPEPEL
jgi:hypothetical protein